MVVPIRYVSADTGSLDVHVDGGLGNVLVIVEDLSFKCGKTAHHRAHRHMGHGEIHGRMVRVNLEFVGCPRGAANRNDSQRQSQELTHSSSLSFASLVTY